MAGPAAVSAEVAAAAVTEISSADSPAGCLVQSAN